MIKSTRLKRTVVKHALFWLIWSGGSVIYMYSLSNYTFYFWDTFIHYSTIASVVYAISLWSFSRFYAKGKNLELVSSILLVMLSFFLFRYFHKIALRPIIAPIVNQKDPFVWESFLIRQTWIFFQHFLFGLGYFSHLNALRKQRENQEKELAIKNGQLREDQARQAIIEAEVNYLRSQFDNHFLFNVLYCFYDKATETDPALAENIYQLSDLMRYTLQQNPGQLVPLAKEIEQTRNFIELCQVYYHNDLQIQWEVEGTTQGKYILPMVLVSLVENALKHGQIRNPEDPLRIELVMNGHISLKMANKKARQQALPTNGAGNMNLQRRLELAYGTKHQLAIHEDASHYCFELILETQPIDA